jgi:hypothetical protein
MLLCVREDLIRLGIEPFLVVRSGSVTARLLEITGLERLMAVHHRVGDALEAARRCHVRAEPPVALG